MNNGYVILNVPKCTFVYSNLFSCYDLRGLTCLMDAFKDSFDWLSECSVTNCVSFKDYFDYWLLIPVYYLLKVSTVLSTRHVHKNGHPFIRNDQVKDTTSKSEALPRFKESASCSASRATRPKANTSGTTPKKIIICCLEYELLSFPG